MTRDNDKPVDSPVSAHTPGPWEVANGTDVFTRLGARNTAGVEAAHNDGWHVADCDMGPSATAEDAQEEITLAEKRANARLIAAAPDMIDALRRLLAQSSYSYMSDANLEHEREQGNAAIPAIQAARAAIAKATGAES